MGRFAFRWRVLTLLALALTVISLPAQAGNPLERIFGGKKSPIPIPGVNGGPKDILVSVLTNVLGPKESSFVLDPNQIFGRVPADRVPTSDNFKPVPLKSKSDINRPLPPGDYSLQVMFYCTQWSVHLPGRGHPYTLGRAQGRLARQMHAMLFRGTLKQLPPATLNAMAWRIQAGVPLSQWSDEEKKLVHELIPEHEKDLGGNWLQRIESSYNKTLRLLTRKSFDDQLRELGDLGTTALNFKAAYLTLADTKVAPERLSLLMFQQFNPGQNPQLPDDPDHPSPWMEVTPGVMARFTPMGGHLRDDNVLEVRVTPEANGQGENGYPTMSEILNGTGKDADKGLVGYSPDSQSPLIEPVLDKPDPSIKIISYQPVTVEDQSSSSENR